VTAFTWNNTRREKMIVMNKFMTVRNNARTLGCTMQTVYTELRRLDIKPYREPTAKPETTPEPPKVVQSYRMEGVRFENVSKLEARVISQSAPPLGRKVEKREDFSLTGNSGGMCAP